MALNSESGNTLLRLWLLLHRVRDVISLAEDSIFREYGITLEQFTVLGNVKARAGGSMRITDLAHALDRSANSISMLVDRMVKAGLVRRIRDRTDRRIVRVSLTDKGENALKPAVPAGWEFIQKVLSPLSWETKQALVNTLETIRGDVICYMNPEEDLAEIIKTSPTNQPDLYKLMVKSVPHLDSEAKGKGGRKRRSTRRS